MAKNKLKKHSNKVEIILDYEKGMAVPSGIHIHKHCTMLDLVLACTRLQELIVDEANAEGKSVTSFLANCANAYVNACDDDEDE